ncbi:hypothetical protein [Thalassoglobus polymorphus]|uniref:Uncharacterized protein n=1 Tax=Thalassoglobus polymorphus TaxID=2527994 RepID=A0A517QSG3_9PLAN|nr:hypothetical protein [Thalassoglobus polymorphus]QDT34551.1 hypothetical protein Mal48_38130 [Thalassoglobus polymorphus]
MGKEVTCPGCKQRINLPSVSCSSTAGDISIEDFVDPDLAEWRNQPKKEIYGTGYGEHGNSHPQTRNSQSQERLTLALTKCKDCDGKVSTRVKNCPHCGASMKQRTHPATMGCAVMFAVSAILFLCCGGLGNVNDRGREFNFSDATDLRPGYLDDSNLMNSENSKSRKWYEGGTLHKKSALDWQGSNHPDKLATCSDFVAAMWQNEKFVPRIQNSIDSVDDMKPYAQELVEYIDVATRRDPDPEQNRRLFTNQTVAAMALLGIIEMGWLK